MVSDRRTRQARPLPANLTLRTIAALVLLTVMTACSMGGPDGGPDGSVDPLPIQVPPGTDPAEGGTVCVLTDRTFGDDVTVPEGLHCVFNNVTIEGNLVLARQARVEHWGGHVDGNVLVYPDAEYRADLGVPVTIGGDVQAEGAAAIRLEGVELDGNLQTLRTDEVEVSSGAVGGNVQTDRGGSVTLTGVAVDGNIQPLQNGGQLTIDSNTVGGDVQPKENTGGVTINDNRIDGNLQCEGNVPPPTGSGNIVQGDAEGQCSALAS